MYQKLEPDVSMIASSIVNCSTMSLTFTSAKLDMMLEMVCKTRRKVLVSSLLEAKVLKPTNSIGPSYILPEERSPEILSGNPHDSSSLIPERLVGFPVCDKPRSL